MTPSPALMDFLKAWEGCRLKRYTDAAGFATIGWGHRLPDDDLTKVWTQEQADKALDEDLGDRAIQLIGLVDSTPLSQNQFDALLSLVFNIGINNFRASTIRHRVLAMNIESVGAQFLLWDKITVDGKKVVSPGLKKRRVAEREMWLRGDYSGRP